MFAIFTTGNKQYKVQPNDVIYVDKLPNKENEEVKFDHVLMVDDKIDIIFLIKIGKKINGPGKNIQLIIF